MSRTAPATLGLAPAVILIATAIAPASAHHSSAMYDDHQTITVEGTVTRYEWANPHVYIYLEQLQDDGQKVEWEVLPL